ncbi:MAG: heme exporter protein CcmD [Candidatus Thioglobus sp.]|jgi:heme exporter protein D
MELLSFDKYAYYIWFSYFLTFAVVAILFIRTQSIHKNVITQLRIKYSRGK